MRSTFSFYLFCVLLAPLFLENWQSVEGVENASPKKIVFLAGKKSHEAGFHEYVRDVKLLKQCLDKAPNLKGIVTEAYFNDWPSNPKVFDSADTIVLLSDGLNEHAPIAQHPFLKDEHLAVIDRQMHRGCGLVVIHWPLWVPQKVGGEKFIPWLGGFCDYQNPPAAGMSDTVDWTKQVSHPICRGLTPFTLEDEYYKNVRFLAKDPRFTPILPFHGNPHDRLWAWAWARNDGGRSFAFIGGHTHAKWKIDSLRKAILNAIVWTAHVEVPADGISSSFVEISSDATAVDSASGKTTTKSTALKAAEKTTPQKPIKTLLLTGVHQDVHHSWRKTTPALQEVLYKDPRFLIDVTTDAEKSLLKLQPGDYDLLVLNYCNWQRHGWSEAARNNFIRFIKDGGGLAIIHFANGAFGPGAHPPVAADNWPEYTTQICRRIWIDEKVGHDPYGPFHVEIGPQKHPITEGMKPFDTVDELYFNQQGTEPVTPLVFAKSKTSGKLEPLVFVHDYGRGRVFQTLFGHDVRATLNSGAAELTRRGCVWAAGRQQ